MAFSLRTWQPTAMHWALAASVAVHAFLLTLRFADPERFNRLFEEAPLEVVLVNASHRQAPVQAQAVAQANLEGGGEAQAGRSTSPLPYSPSNQLGEGADEAERAIAQMQQMQMQLLAQVRAQLSALPPPDPTRTLTAAELAKREQQRRIKLQQLAEIEKRINEENARPRKRYISPATREEVYALYYDALRRKIEERGTRDFPTYRNQKLYGELTMNFTIDARGELLEAEVVRPSKLPELNRRAQAIVRAAGPFGPFTHEMRRRADQIVVTSRFRFTRTDQLETTLTADPQE